MEGFTLIAPDAVPLATAGGAEARLSLRRGGFSAVNQTAIHLNPAACLPLHYFVFFFRLRLASCNSSRTLLNAAVDCPGSAVPVLCVFAFFFWFRLASCNSSRTLLNAVVDCTDPFAPAFCISLPAGTGEGAAGVLCFGVERLLDNGIPFPALSEGAPFRAASRSA